MAATDRKEGLIKRIEEFLSTVDINVSKTSDGSFIVYTTQDPLFCFVRPTLDELKPVIVDTLVSYIKNFFDAGAIDVAIESITEEKSSPRTLPPIPTETLVTFSRARPFVRRAPGRELEPA